MILRIISPPKFCNFIFSGYDKYTLKVKPRWTLEIPNSSLSQLQSIFYKVTRIFDRYVPYSNTTTVEWSTDEENDWKFFSSVEPFLHA